MHESSEVADELPPQRIVEIQPLAHLLDLHVGRVGAREEDRRISGARPLSKKVASMTTTMIGIAPASLLSTKVNIVELRGSLVK